MADWSDEELMQAFGQSQKNAAPAPSWSDDDLMQAYQGAQPKERSWRESIYDKALAAGDTASFGFQDEAAGYLRSLVNGTNYEQERDAIRGDLDRMRQERPGEALGWGITGALGPSLGAGILRAGGILGASKAIPAVTQTSSALVRNAGNIAKGAGIGAASGAAYGYGSGEGGVDQRVDEAQSQGAVGAMFGAALPTAAAVWNSAKGLGNGIYRTFSPKSADIRAGEILQKTSPDLLSKLNQPSASTALTPFQSTAERTLDPGMAALEKSILRGLPDLAAEQAGRGVERQTARSGLLDALAPNRKGLEEAGESISDSLRGAYDDTRNAVSQKFQALDPAKATRIEIFPEKVRVQDLKTQLFGTTGSAPLHGEVANIFEEFVNTENRQPLAVLQNLRSRAMAAASDAGKQAATGTPGARQSAVLGREIGNALDNAVEAATQREAPELARSADLMSRIADALDARPANSRGRVNMFPAKKAAQDARKELFGQKGKYPLYDDAAKFFDEWTNTPNLQKPQTVQQFAARARQLSQDAAEMAKRGDGIDQETAAAWKAARAARAEQGSLFERGAVGDVLKKETFGEMKLDRSRVPNKLLSTPEAVEQALIASKRDPAVVSSLRGVVVDDLFGKGTNAATDGFNASSFIKNYNAKKPVIEKLFDSKHVAQLDELADDLSREAKVIELSKTASKGGSPTDQFANSSKFFQGLFSSPSATKRVVTDMIFSSVGGVVGGVPGAIAGPAVSELAQTFMAKSDAALKRKLFEAAMDPDVARALLEKASPRNVSYVIQKMISSDTAATVGVSANRALQSDKQKALPEPSPVRALPAPEQSVSPFSSALEAVESSGNARAVSPAGAQGIRQLMPETGRAYHQRLGIKEPYDPFNVSQARQISDAYLADLQKKYGDIALALAGYNLGETKLDAAIRSAGSRDWQQVQRFVPEETRNYPGKVLSRVSG